MAETPHPRSILRGHGAQVHALAFVRNNSRLASGDAVGFVVLWDLTTLRPTVVWRPHENAILGIQGWGEDCIITHGRDHKLAVWKISSENEAGLSRALPLDSNAPPRPQPWLLHLIEVNTMNFCTFASCPPLESTAQSSEPELLVAVPNTLASESIDIFHLPSQTRRDTVKSPGTNGMVMALALLHAYDRLTLVAGYENGVAAVMQLSSDSSSDNGIWTVTYKAKAHSEPILSLDVAPDHSYFLTSAADAIVAKHPVLTASAAQTSAPASSATATAHDYPIKVTNTKHAGQQGLRLRDDGRIFATGGWDAMVRVYSSKTLKEVAVLKWHQVGCYAVAFANILSSSASSAPLPGASAEKEGPGQDVGPRTGELSVKDRRIQHAKTAHWLAAGSKDGKISLWDVF
ncbi:WD40 repeat-like protein [Sodiomyces alkalinus F11]|uniref:ASTRA-associated protein 1 n=1 Tax=Sodiomyces alkalinus (strain CBS 110278 / VKM F-3762 / F11) TaxID=1314773 RepID=A0A3N2Q559_SODAK|nr:WD40 repeat-like protein [Sodiomyces alkalinus F11]ROT41901.1 WD40 repeat-like protein [Sodiomyces alkalinus F11]